MRVLAPLALLAALGLAACESPREACINQGARELRTVEALIRETEGTLRRGYAIEETQVVRVRPGFCEFTRPDGSIGRRTCDRTEVRDVSRPRAVDLAEEQRKLRSLQERRARLAAEQAARVQACVAAYPQ
jgi:hypothetical protein